MQKGSKTGTKKKRKTALGRGLSALIPDIESTETGQSNYFQCSIEKIRPNRYQPRLRFNEDELEDLSRSIKTQGIIQPLLVRKDKNEYELVTGERRLRASKMAGLKQVPVILKNISDEDLLEMSIVENIQREDLNPVEEADAYHNLMTRFKLTQNQTAERIGKSRSTIANFLRLRQLPEQIKDSLRENSLSMGHARALLGAETTAIQMDAWRTVVSKNLSVRETENLIKHLKKKARKPQKPVKTAEENYYTDIADDLSRHFGTKVKLIRRGKSGKVEIDFYSDEDLDRLLGLLKPS